MFLFGHIGITLGASILVAGAVTTLRQPRFRRESPLQPESKSNRSQSVDRKTCPIAKWTVAMGNFFDLRLLIIGSLLPDIIDKPIGMFLFGNGRVFTHSLLITFLLLMIGTFLALNHKKTGVLAVGIGTAMHLILDEMWRTPNILFWPSLGWRFPAGTRESYLPVWIQSLSHSPSVDISEAVGLIIIAGFIWILISRRKMLAFMLKGRLA